MRVVETGRNLRSIVTRRSLLPPPADRGGPTWHRSWDHLFRLYAPAMARYARSILSRARKQPVGIDEAEDVVQAYLAACLEKGWLDRDGERIRCFRAWLQTQLRRFCYQHIEHEFAQKRSPPARAAPGALDDAPGSEPDPADAELDRGWAEVAVELALEEMRTANPDYHEVILDLIRTDGEGSADLGARMRRNARQMKNLRHRARRRFAVRVHEHLRHSVRDDEAFEVLCRRIEPHLP